MSKHPCPIGLGPVLRPPRRRLDCQTISRRKSDVAVVAGRLRRRGSVVAGEQVISALTTNWNWNLYWREVNTPQHYTGSGENERFGLGVRRDDQECMSRSCAVGNEV